MSDVGLAFAAGLHSMAKGCDSLITYPLFGFGPRVRKGRTLPYLSRCGGEAAIATQKSLRARRAVLYDLHRAEPGQGC